MDPREAFDTAVIKFQSPEWSPADPDRDTFEFGGRYLTIRQVCEVVKDDKGQLPDWIVGQLMRSAHGDRELLQLLGQSRTYATGSQCLLKLLEDRERKFQQQQ